MARGVDDYGGVVALHFAAGVVVGKVGTATVTIEEIIKTIKNFNRK